MAKAYNLLLMALKKFGKRITIDQLAAMVAEGFLRIEEKMVTKEEAKKFITKEDAKNFITKEDAKNFATKEDVEKILDRKMDEKLAPIHKKLDYHGKRLESLEEKVIVLKRVISKDLKTSVNW